MQNLEEISTTESAIESTLISLDKQVTEYMKALREISSHEILSGSLAKAQSLIAKIINIERKVDNLKQVHADFRKIVKGNGYSSEQVNKINEKQIKGETELKKSNEISPSYSKQVSRFRMPILKALIYLGGNATTEDIIEYIKKELRKLLTNEEKNLSEDELYVNWTIELEAESLKMTKENLVNFEIENERWEILPEGIDFLARNDS